MIKEASRAVFDEVGNEFKAGIAAVVGVRDFVMIMFRAEVGEFSYFGAFFIGFGKFDDVGVVFIVHG